MRIAFSTKERRKIIPTQMMEGTPMGLHRRHLPTPEHLRPRHWRDGRPYSSAAPVSSHTHVADAVKKIKANSSLWMSREIGRFAWQQGYGGFGVSKSNIAAVVRYVRNQEQHHKKMTFEEEFIALLKRHGIEYDPRYVLVNVSRLRRSSLSSTFTQRLPAPARQKAGVPGAPVRAGLTSRRASGAGLRATAIRVGGQDAFANKNRSIGRQSF
jgi:hypothetical protein